MPYVIRTGLDGQDTRYHSRTAVATLEEARETIAPTILAASPNHVWHLAESGGTIGPLPDGTVIEVRQASWFELRRMTGRAPGESLGADARETRTNVLAAFNGSQL